MVGDLITLHTLNWLKYIAIRYRCIALARLMPGAGVWADTEVVCAPTSKTASRVNIKQAAKPQSFAHVPRAWDSKLRSTRNTHSPHGRLVIEGLAWEMRRFSARFVTSARKFTQRYTLFKVCRVLKDDKAQKLVTQFVVFHAIDHLLIRVGVIFLTTPWEDLVFDSWCLVWPSQLVNWRIL